MSSNEVNLTPRSLGTKPEKMKNSEDPVRKLTTRAHMQKGEGSRRLGKQHQAKQAVGWADVGPGRPAQPISRPNQPPL
jgi:hypothetical protein